MFCCADKSSFGSDPSTIHRTQNSRIIQHFKDFFPYHLEHQIIDFFLLFPLHTTSNCTTIQLCGPLYHNEPIWSNWNDSNVHGTSKIVIISSHVDYRNLMNHHRLSQIFTRNNSLSDELFFSHGVLKYNRHSLANWYLLNLQHVGWFLVSDSRPAKNLNSRWHQKVL